MDVTGLLPPPLLQLAGAQPPVQGRARWQPSSGSCKERSIEHAGCQRWRAAGAARGESAARNASQTAGGRAKGRAVLARLRAALGGGSITEGTVDGLLVDFGQRLQGCQACVGVGGWRGAGFGSGARGGALRIPKHLCVSQRWGWLFAAPRCKQGCCIGGSAGRGPPRLYSRRAVCTSMHFTSCSSMTCRGAGLAWLVVPYR